MTREFYANGKLLLTGEYLVLHGAGALVLPLKKGQQIRVTETGTEKYPVIKWQATMQGEFWFQTGIRLPGWELVSTNNQPVALRLIRLLQEASWMNEALFQHNRSYDVVTETGFDINWGFGSSAALVANVAQWAKVDPFELNYRTFGGSGADIAAAISSGPVIYQLIRQKPFYYRVEFSPSFYEHLWIIYSGRKQDTSQSVQTFGKVARIAQKKINRMDELTIEIARSIDLYSFMQLIREHEEILSAVLERPEIGKTLFPDFHGVVKSLGAWGGDFMLAASEDDEVMVKNYFIGKDLATVFPLKEMAL
jgi:mevalonate kinase